MRTISVLISSIFIFMLSSCQHTNESLNIPLNYTQLNTVIAPWQKDNKLLPWKGQLHTMIINSVEDVYTTQTERFIEENPNWLHVDFSSHSIIAVRTILFAFNHWQYTTVLNFFQVNQPNEAFDFLKGDYRISFVEKYSPYSDTEDEDESQYRIYQFAIVTTKIPADARVHVYWGQNQKEPAKN